MDTISALTTVFTEHFWCYPVANLGSLLGCSEPYFRHADGKGFELFKRNSSPIPVQCHNIMSF